MPATSILSRDFGAVCMTKIAYIYSRLSRTHTFPFHFDSQRQHALLYSDLQRQLILSILTHRDNTPSYIFHLQSQHTLHIFTYRVNTFFPFRFTETTRSLKLRLTETTHILSLTFWLPAVNSPKCILAATIFFFVHGRRHVPPNLIIKIL